LKATWLPSEESQEKQALPIGHHRAAAVELARGSSTTLAKSIKWYSPIAAFVAKLLERDSLAEIAVFLSCAFVVSTLAPLSACTCERPERGEVVTVAVLWMAMWIRIFYLIAKTGKDRTFNLSRAPIFGICAMFFFGAFPSLIGQGSQFGAIWAVVTLSAAALFTASYLVLVLLLRRKLPASVWFGSLTLIAGVVRIIYDITSKK
jgi:hypothetical protein